VSLFNGVLANRTWTQHPIVLLATVPVDGDSHQIDDCASSLQNLRATDAADDLYILNHDQEDLAYQSRKLERRLPHPVGHIWQPSSTLVFFRSRRNGFELDFAHFVGDKSTHTGEVGVNKELVP
jgi:hypothetical protein